MSTQAMCACGQPADSSNGLECRGCWKERVGSVAVQYRPSATPGSGRSMGRGAEGRWDRRLDRYAAARAEGIQPENTSTRKVDEALRLSDEAGRAYRSDRVSLEAAGRSA